MIGRTVSHYEILERLGSGGMGVVYKASDSRLDRLVALKFLTDELSGDELATDRFIQEARAASALEHSNICTVYDIGSTEDGRMYIVMPHYSGQTLKYRMKDGPLSVEKSIDVARQIAKGLERAHDAGIVHRDIKPANIMVTDRGEVKILDFGVAKLQGVDSTRTGTTVGTVWYMSPEQTRGETVDGRSDLWSLGVVLFEMLTGRKPFAGDYDQAIAYSIMNADPGNVKDVNGAVIDRVADVVRRLLEKDPNDRYQTASEVIAAPALADSFLSPTPTQTDSLVDSDGPNQHLTKSGLVALSSAALFVVLAIVLYVLLGGEKPAVTPDESREVEAATEKGRVDALIESYGDKSIAVLAFADMSPEGDHEYFSDGIAEELLNLLATIRELRVISRSTAFTFKGSDASLPDIAEKLGVTYILEGSVRKAGDKIRVTAQLIDARTDTHLWSDTYDRTLDDVFAIQDEISASIVEQLKLTLVDGDLSAQKIDPGAYEKYLRALFIVNTSNMDQLREAQSLLNEVLAIAPDYIPALNALGRLYYRIPKTEGLSRAENTAEIHALANRVVEIEPNGSSSLIWQGWFAFLDSDFLKAATYYEQAVRVDANNINLLRVLVPFLTDIGRPEDAIALGHYLLLRDPACAVCIGNLSYAYRAVGKHAESAQILESSLVWHEPDTSYYGRVGTGWLMAGDPEQALAAFESATGSRWHEKGAIMALHDLGRLQEFDSRFSELRSNGQDPAIIVRIYAWVGDNDKAFEWLDKMPEADQQNFIGSIDADFYAKIRTDDRWQAMREKYGQTDDASNEAINFTYTLPAGAASNDH